MSKSRDFPFNFNFNKHPLSEATSIDENEDYADAYGRTPAEMLYYTPEYNKGSTTGRTRV